MGRKPTYAQYYECGVKDNPKPLLNAEDKRNLRKVKIKIRRKNMSPERIFKWERLT